MPKCPICETKVDKYIETYISDFNNQEYKLYYCSNCDLQWWEPLRMISEFYENETFEMYVNFHKGYRREASYYHKEFLEIIPIKNGKLLDIGCGDGRFLQLAKKFGFEVWGIDFDSKSVAVAKQRINSKNVYSMSLEDFTNFAQENNLKFDFITFFEVLEHQDKPKEFLEAIKKILKKGGFIGGSVPNRDSPIQKKLYRDNCYIDNPPHHFLRFSQKALYKSLLFLKFTNINLTVPPPPFRESSRFIQEIILRTFFPKKFQALKLKYTNRISIEEDITISQKVSLYLIRVYRFLRNYLFFPFNILLRNKWPHILFLAQYEG